MNQKLLLTNDEHTNSGRRSFFHTISKSLVLLIPTEANSACMSGDTSKECIGIYKLPIDAAESPFLETAEKTKAYAPDLKWVPPVEFPSNYPNALNQLKQQRQQLDTVQDLIAKGEIENAGLVLLDIIPKVNAAGIVLIKSFGSASNEERNAAMKQRNNIITDGSDGDGNPSSTLKATTLEMKAYRIEYALNELLGFLGDTDVMLGQALRGELGVSAPAQIQILSEITECQREFDNLLLAIPEKFP